MPKSGWCSCSLGDFAQVILLLEECEQAVFPIDIWQQGSYHVWRELHGLGNIVFSAQITTVCH